MADADLTARQKSVLDFVADHQQRHHIAPTVREIAAHLGLKSPAGIHRILNILKTKGHLLAEPGKKRSWRLTGDIPGSSIPVIDSFTTGIPLEALKDSNEVLKVDHTLFGNVDCFGLRVRGDSMIGANIADGDIAIIQPQQQVENGEIAAVLVEDQLTEITLKIIERTSTALTLKTANPTYRPIVFWWAGAQRVSIIGKYVGLIRQV